MFLIEQCCSFIADCIWIFATPEGHRLIDNSYSQLYAQTSILDTWLIPIQANSTAEVQGISFALNDTVVKIGRALTARRNARFHDKCRETRHYSNTGLPGTPPT